MIFNTIVIIHYACIVWSMYTYKKLMGEVKHLARAGVETGVIGQSVQRREIPYIFAGDKRGACVFITAGIHAREHIGCYLVMRQVYRALNHAAQITPLGGIYFLPMLNPDGNELARCCCPLYKANANRVDLNVNFDADWGTGKQNVFAPADENYVGTHPFSEPETRALRDFTLLHKPAATVSYHAIGRELYWDFGQSGASRARDEKLALHLNKVLHYTIIPFTKTSAGGYKDWCIQKLNIPSFTIELVSPEHPHPFTHYALAADDIKRNLDLPARLLQAL
ncbi:MAG: hypothetical protein FWH03_02795 [Firmicutes bacterium]|nr:hypothetical protein [Bacillota bacterium]